MLSMGSAQYSNISASCAATYYVVICILVKHNTNSDYVVAMGFVAMFGKLFNAGSKSAKSLNFTQRRKAVSRSIIVRESQARLGGYLPFWRIGSPLHWS